MNSLSEIESRYTFLRGNLDHLEGSQDFPLFSWVRFELGYETILFHGLFLLPPRLAEGDEVVVAGNRHRNFFDAMACFKPGESNEECERRKRSERLRQRFWFSVLYISGVAAALFFGLSFFPALLSGLVLARLVLATLCERHRQAKVELALALARARDVTKERKLAAS